MESEIKDKEKNLRIFINGIPDLKLVPKEKFDSFICALELQISEYYSSKNENNIASLKSQGYFM